MKKVILFSFVAVLTASSMACSKVSFSNSAAAGSTAAGGYDYTYSTTGVVKTDLLFVVDNSASMSVLQQQMGTKFPSLFSRIQGLDYHIAITNTDVTSANNPQRSEIAGFPYTQDGQLIPFPDGSKVLSNASNNPQSQFLQTIIRPETSQCQQYIQNFCPNGCSDQATLHYYCPSEETRAIEASLMTVQSSSGFIRDSSVPLNIIILSNADERGSGGILSDYPMESNDQPSALISTVSQAYPGKQLKVHSMIIEPGDGGCYNAQYQTFGKFIFGWYGNVYAALSQSTGGVMGNVCAPDYSSTLTNIAISATADNGDRDLPCQPQNNQVTVTLSNGQTPAYYVQSTSAGAARLIFTQAVPPQVSVRVQILKCS